MNWVVVDKLETLVNKNYYKFFTDTFAKISKHDQCISANQKVLLQRILSLGNYDHSTSNCKSDLEFTKMD